MIKRISFPKVFFGWWTVLASGFITLWGTGYYYIGGSALFKPIASELGFSRATTSVAASIGRFEGGFESPLTGWITDKFGPRWIITLGVFTVGLGLILMKFIDSLWAYYLVWGIITGTGVNIAMSVPVDKAITNWFVKKRGLALSIKWMCSGLAVAGVLPLIAWLISTQGWRMACFIGGIVMWVAGLPLAWFCVKQHRPEYYGLLPDGATAEENTKGISEMIEKGVRYAAEFEEVEFTLRQATKTPAYWLLIVAGAGQGMLNSVFWIHCMPFLTDMGIDPLRAAVVMGMISLVGMPMRFIGGFGADHLKKDHLRFLMGGAYFIQAAGVTTFLLSQTIAVVYVFLILFYCGMGLSMPLNAIIRGRYFGRKGFGSIQGTSAMLLSPTSMLAPIYAGWIYDTTGSYIKAFALLAVLTALSAVIMSLIRPPRPPVHVTDVRQFI